MSKSGRKKKGIRNPAVVFLCLMFGLLFAAMIGYMAQYSYTHRVELINNSYNGMQKALLSKNTRGSILAADGTVLAQTISDGNGGEKRQYPFGDEYAHIIGYATKGRAGVEAIANYDLINTHVSLARKAELEAAHLKYPGDNVITTLDSDLQAIAYRALTGYRGAVVVSDVRTGKLLAMVSNPTFDPNTIDENWKTLTASTNAELLNRASQGLYPPGSTFKIITALEYIRQNPEGYRNYQFDCSGTFVHGEDVIHCFHGTKHGHVDFDLSFAKSCNSSFANIGLSLDRTHFEQTLHDLMFDQDLPVDLPASRSKAYCDQTTSDSDLMQLSIGQGQTAMTPLHLNLITQAIANNGTLMKPYVISRVESTDGKTVREVQPQTAGTLMTAEEAGILQHMMELVVTEGTGKRLKDQPYTAAGKTGSAEYSNATTDSHAWFTGFAPAEAPEISVTVIIEEAGSGGEIAVPIAKQILDGYYAISTE